MSQESRRKPVPAAAVNSPHSRRTAKANDIEQSRQRLECGGFSTASAPRFIGKEYPGQSVGDSDLVETVDGPSLLFPLPEEAGQGDGGLIFLSRL
jgi:hypothetical protein